MSVWLLGLALVLAAWAWSRLRVDVLALADTAARTGDASPVLHALRKSDATEYHRVMRRLWDGYHREVAVAVAMDLARRHQEAPVSQFWLKQYIQNEPEIASAHLDDAFMAAFFDPAVAAKCGSFG